MGRIWFSPGDFADHLHEIVGYKAGLASSIEQMCDLLSGTSYADDILRSESNGLAIRSEDYEDLYYQLLYKVGVTNTSRPGLFTQSQFFIRVMKEKGLDYITDLQNIYSKHYKLGVDPGQEREW
ncbi:restriction endonuclease, partial [Aliivibrio fischeri]|nr:restriction endonuclease [Aliivibrio fischeri]